MPDWCLNDNNNRTLYTRGNQHIGDFNRNKRYIGLNNSHRDYITSFIHEHQEESHGDDAFNPRTDIVFNILSKPHDPFDRQIVEAIQIKQAPQKKVIIDKECAEVQ